MTAQHLEALDGIAESEQALGAVSRNVRRLRKFRSRRACATRRPRILAGEMLDLRMRRQRWRSRRERHLSHSRPWSRMSDKNEGHFVAAVADTHVLRRATADRHLFARPARLRSERAARSLLAFQTVAHGDAHRLAFASDAELSAAARCDARHASSKAIASWARAPCLASSMPFWRNSSAASLLAVLSAQVS